MEGTTEFAIREPRNTTNPSVEGSPCAFAPLAETIEKTACAFSFKGLVCLFISNTLCPSVFVSILDVVNELFHFCCI